MIVYVDLDDTVFDFMGAFTKAINKCPHITFPQSQYGFFANLKPLPGAVEGLTYLFDNFDTWILTAPSIHNPLCYTEKRVSVEKHFGMLGVERLILSPNKGLLKGDYLIDDLVTGHGKENNEYTYLDVPIKDLVVSVFCKDSQKSEVKTYLTELANGNMNTKNGNHFDWYVKNPKKSDFMYVRDSVNFWWDLENDLMFWIKSVDFEKKFKEIIPFKPSKV